LTSILHRYCDNHGLQGFVHPPGDWPGLTADRGKLQDYLALLEARNRSVDMWANHASFEPDLFDRMVPGNAKISLFREPFGRVISSFGHGSLARIKDAVRKLRRNILLREECGDEGTRMSELVQASQFPLLDFVLLTERYEEGLVMMRRKFGWAKRDIMHLKLKVTSSRKRGALQNLTAYLSQPARKLTPAARFLLGRCVRGAEATIYKMARDRFQSQWEALGASAQREVSDEVGEFKAALARLAECCSANARDDFCVRLQGDNVKWVREHRPSVDTKCSDHGFV